jgi:uncharacterized protein (DUF2147 family)
MRVKIRATAFFVRSDALLRIENTELSIMIRYALLAAASLLPISAFATVSAAATPDPSGIWMRSDGNARVIIKRCGKAYCATNIWVKDTSNGEAIGDRLVMNVSPQSENVLAGTAYDAKRQLTYSMEISVQPGSLSSRGCVIGGMVCKTLNWSH